MLILLILFLILLTVAAAGATWTLAADGPGSAFLRRHLPLWLVGLLARAGAWFDSDDLGLGKEDPYARRKASIGTPRDAVAPFAYPPAGPPYPQDGLPQAPWPQSTPSATAVPAPRPAPQPPALAPEDTQPVTGMMLSPSQTAVIAETAGFEPEDDVALIEHMRREIAFQGAHADAWRAFLDHCLLSLGLDPGSVQGVAEYADVRADSAHDASGMLRQFIVVYEQVREWVASGGTLPHDGRWLTGEGA